MKFWSSTTSYALLLILITLLSIAININCSKAQPEDSNRIVEESQNHGHKNISSLKITTLSTMLASQGLGEWGFSALVEVDGKKILFDTGRFSETVLKNAETLGIDLSEVEDVFLSHNHGDHTGGLLTLRAEMKKRNPQALSKIHVGRGIFAQRINVPNRMLEKKEILEAEGVEFIVYDTAQELFPGVWISGPIERFHKEKNFGGQMKIATAEGTVVDNIPEDQSLILDTEKGFVLIAGCGHAGIINTMEHIQAKIHKEKVYAAMGGFHLVNATDEHLQWTANKLKSFGLEKIVGAHCTGINSLFTLKNLLGFDRSNAVVGSVGDSFDLENGIRPSIIAR